MQLSPSFRVLPLQPTYTMNWKTILMLVVPLLAVSLLADEEGKVKAPAPVASAPLEINLRYVSATEALVTLLKKLGPEGMEAVAKVDLKRNVLTLDDKHPQAAQVREALAGLDHKPELLRIEATMRRHFDATKNSPARDAVLSRPTVEMVLGRTATLTLPEEGGSLTVDLKVSKLRAD